MTMLENNRARTGRCARLPVMVRVQRQRSLTAYRPCYAIRQGTLFPALNKPLRTGTAAMTITGTGTKR